MPKNIVITDTSCLILLDKIQALYLLPAIYTHILTTPEIAKEFKYPLPQWIQIIPVKNTELIDSYADQVDIGEASAIALAQELPADTLLIIDDSKGRRLAAKLHLKVTGTIGVMIDARQQNKISTLRPYFEAVKSTNFRIAPELLDAILNQFND